MKATLYKKDSTGKTREWNIEVTDLSTEAKIRITAGILNGKLVEQVTTVRKGKNIGRANETTYWTQAVADAQSKINAQLKDGYVDDLANMIDASLKGSGAIGMMLAKPYDPTKKQSGSKDFAGYKLAGKLIGKQRKYDGVRRITRITSEAATMFSRGGDSSSTLPHIEAQLLQRFNEIKDILGVEEIWIDGEAYSHEIPFEKINGITRRGAENEQERAEALDIQYHIYDVVMDVCYSERYEILKHFISEHVQLVETEWVYADPEDLEKSMIEYILEGYEGLMIRLKGVGYQPNKRSPFLLKYKAFEDAEFECIGVNGGKVDGQAATLTVKVDRPCFDSNGKEITEFYPTLVGKKQQLRWALQNSDYFIGKTVTVNFMGRSEGGIPRHCRVKDVRYDI